MGWYVGEDDTLWSRLSKQGGSNPIGFETWGRDYRGFRLFVRSLGRDEGGGWLAVVYGPDRWKRTRRAGSADEAKAAAERIAEEDEGQGRLF